MDCKYIIFGISLIFLFIAIGQSVSAFKFDKNDFVNVQVSIPSGDHNAFSFNVDYVWFQGDDRTDPIFIYHNKDAKQQTIKTHRGDLWSTHFNRPGCCEVGGINGGWLVKTSHDGVKVRNDLIYTKW